MSLKNRFHIENIHNLAELDKTPSYNPNVDIILSESQPKKPVAKKQKRASYTVSTQNPSGPTSTFQDDEIIQDLDLFANCKALRGFTTDNNSCYMDSLFMLLFTVLRSWTDMYILDRFDRKYDVGEMKQCHANSSIDKKIRTDIKNAMISMRNYIYSSHSGASCPNKKIRNEFEKCDALKDQFKKGKMNDPAELISKILSISKTDLTKFKDRTMYYRTEEDGTRTFLRENEKLYDGEPTQPIKSYDLHKVIRTDPDENFTTDSMIKIKEYIPTGKVDGEDHDYVEKTTTVMDSSVLFVNITRSARIDKDDRVFKEKTIKELGDDLFLHHIKKVLGINTPTELDDYLESEEGKQDVSRILEKARRIVDFDDIEIVPSKSITLGSGKVLYYAGSLMFESNHYTAMLFCGGSWFLYNGIPRSKVEKVADLYNDVIKRKDILRNATTHLYIDKEYCSQLIPPK